MDDELASAFFWLPNSSTGPRAIRRPDIMLRLMRHRPPRTLVGMEGGVEFYARTLAGLGLEGARHRVAPEL